MSRKLLLASLVLLAPIAGASPAGAVVYCKTVGVPKGCVNAPPAGVVVAPAPVGVAPAPVVRSIAPGVAPRSAVNRGGPVNRVGIR